MSNDLSSGHERMFKAELAAIGATLDAFIVRSSREWFPTLYCYRVTRADGTTAVGAIPWDLDTFSAVLAAAKGN